MVCEKTVVFRERIIGIKGHEEVVVGKVSFGVGIVKFSYGRTRNCGSWW